MEDTGILDINDHQHRWALQYVFQPRIQSALNISQDCWNNHRMSSLHGRTPVQIYVEGVLRMYGGGTHHINELFCDPRADVDIPHDEIETFGIDWDGPHPNVTNEETVRVEDPHCLLSEVALNQLRDFSGAIS